MPKASPLQNDFSGGEFSPLYHGRVDAKRYGTGLATCLNYIPMLQGGLTKRPGTKFASVAKDSTKATRVVRFEFSTTQAYILEFGDQYIRFYRNNAIITGTTQAITAATAANPVVVTYDGADTFANSDRVVITGVLGMTELNNREFTVANVNVGANTFELSGINGTGYTAYTSAGAIGEIYEIASPYLEADLFQLKFTQSADVLYIAHPSYAPRKLTRSAHTNWTLTAITFLDGPFLATNATTTTLLLGGTTGSVSVTASAVTGINGGDGFKSTDIGRLIRWKDPAGNWTWLTITAWTSTTVVTATISGPNASAVTATVNWRLGVWSTNTGFPAAVSFHEDRLFWAGATSYSTRLDGSNTGDYENMAPSNAAGTIVDSNAVAFSLNANEVNAIRWLVSDEKGMLAGTAGGEWVVRPSSTAEALSPTNISAKQATRYGSANVAAVQIGKSVAMVQKSGRKVREMAYFFDVDGFRSPELTSLAEHIHGGSSIKEVAYQKEPQSILWAVRNDGVLLGMTYERDLESLKVGWHRHTLGGYSNSGRTVHALVESVAIIPSSDGSREEVWMVVKRYINGGAKRYIEYMTKVFEDADAQEDAFFVDCGLTYDSASTSTISGLFHLEGESVSVLGNGAVQTSQTVANGKITLSAAAPVVQVGYTYNSDGKTLRFEAGAADGTALGKTRRTHRVGFLFHRTLGHEFGPDFDHLDTLTFSTTGDELDQSIPLFTGIKSETIDMDYDFENQICWRQSQPLPSTILAVAPQMVTQDRG